jgi:hypothetical protein
VMLIVGMSIRGRIIPNWKPTTGWIIVSVALVGATIYTGYVQRLETPEKTGQTHDRNTKAAASTDASGSNGIPQQ